MGILARLKSIALAILQRINWTDYLMGIDVWEGALDILEQVLWDNGVRFIFIRINDTVGGLHLDKNFLSQWLQATIFARGVYYVVAPWISWQEQAEWLANNLPPDCNVVSLDVELKGDSPAVVSEIVTCLMMDLLSRGKKVIIYTGQWFLPYCSPWPKTVKYWWARYLNVLYPANSVTTTWEPVKETITQQYWSPDNGLAPNTVCCWQISADRYILPGTAGRAIDINVMPKAEFEELFAIPQPKTWKNYLPIMFR